MTIEELQEDLSQKLSNPLDIAISTKGERILVSKGNTGYITFAFSGHDKNISFRLVQTSPEMIIYPEHSVPATHVDIKIITMTCVKDNKNLSYEIIKNQGKKSGTDSDEETSEDEMWISQISNFLQKAIRISKMKACNISYDLNSNKTASISISSTNDNRTLLSYKIRRFEIYEEISKLTTILNSEDDYEGEIGNLLEQNL